MAKNNYLETKWYAAMQRASYIALTTLPGSVPAIVFENELKGLKLRATAVTSERSLVKFESGTWERCPDEVEISLNLANAIARSWFVCKSAVLDTSIVAVSEDAAWNNISTQRNCQELTA